MAIISDAVEKYLNSGIEDIVKESILNFRDVKFDNYNNQGCNGYIFFGEHEIFRRRVAVKFYYFGEDSHEEVMLLKNVKHNNILNIRDASIVGDGWAYFITDEICQGTIDDYLNENNISLIESLKITMAILSGLSELHRVENNLLHRDIKPANILLENCNPIIADFGSVKRIEKGSTFVNPSKNSLLYKPPESITDEIYTVQSDIYQVGIVMFQVFGGQISYNFTDYLNSREMNQYNNFYDDYEKSKFVDLALEKKICNGKLINFDSLPFYVSNRIKKIIRNATHLNLEKRYSNTSEFFLDLHKLGTVPDWKKSDNDNYLCKYKDAKYRVRKTPKGFVFEKESNTWRKVQGVDYCPSKKLFEMIDSKLKAV